MTIRKTFAANADFWKRQLVVITAIAAGACSQEAPPEQTQAAAPPPAVPEAQDMVEPAMIAAVSANENELPTWKIPNIPRAAEAYYAPDNLHVIAQTQDPDALKAEGRDSGALTYTFTDQGENVRRINDRGQDACSYFLPDGSGLIWTSTRDNMDMPIGNWSDSNDYPQGAELYLSDLEGGDIKRLTDNEYYEAEVSVSPNGEWIVFGRQIDGKMDLWRMRPDGSEEEQVTFTDDWQEGAPFYLPDNETILTRAWKRSEYGKIRPTPMTVFTVNAETKEITERTFDRDMNWAPYPAPDGRHYVFVRVVADNNWEVFLGDLAGGEPVRLTFNDSFDGFPSLSPDGTKMLF
ncbi:MAG: PD40 domain-containing protein, partial [Gammaproteobacteria bacterium]|nr:PD40 domain-containing protein [Gammaproteobacteria bacterium]